MGNKSIFTIAEFFIFKANQQLDIMTQLKLQKLCYYAQAWYLALTETQLFSEDFEAWVHGPANYDLYTRYKKYGWDSINEKTNFAKEQFTDTEIDFLNNIWEKYGRFDAKVLENLTHQEDPWIDARAGLSDYENSNKIIEKDRMKDFYRAMLVV